MKPLKQILDEDLQKWEKEIEPQMMAATGWLEVKALYDAHNTHVESLKKKYVRKENRLRMLVLLGSVIFAFILSAICWSIITLLVYWTFEERWMWMSISIIYSIVLLLRIILFILELAIKEIKRRQNEKR